jgi:hypothetical protein
MVRGLRPDDPVDWIRDVLEAEEDDVLAAGHMPQIAQLSMHLGSDTPIPIHGVVTLERVGSRRYVERWRAQPPENL